MKIYEKLLQIQTRLNVPKGQYNDFGNFNYRSCEDIQNAVKPFLQELGLILKIGDEIVMIGSRFYVKATAVLIDCETGEKVENIAYAREDESKPKMDGAQMTGSSSSYARKYALNGLFCLDDVKDPDAQKRDAGGGNGQKNAQKNGQNQNQNQNQRPTGQQGQQKGNNAMKPKGQQKEKLNDADFKSLVDEMKRTGYRTGDLIREYKVNSLRELTGNKYRDAMRKLRGTPNRDDLPRAATFGEIMSMTPPDNIEGAPWNR